MEEVLGREGQWERRTGVGFFPRGDDQSENRSHEKEGSEEELNINT